MFGCCIAGRLLQTNLQQVDETHALFELPAADTINHICVFLLGTVPFPDGFGATVHFFWPGKGSQVLGMLSNEKPSAIFRLRGTFSTSVASTPTAFSSTPQYPSDAPPNGVTAILGLAIEPLANIQVQMETLSSSNAVSTLSADISRDPSMLAQRVVKHLFNYVSGFVPGDAGAITPDSVIPLGIIIKWYESFTRKIKVGGIGFLENQE